MGAVFHSHTGGSGLHVKLQLVSDLTVQLLKLLEQSLFENVFYFETVRRLIDPCTSGLAATSATVTLIRSLVTLCSHRPYFHPGRTGWHQNSLIGAFIWSNNLTDYLRPCKHTQMSEGNRLP